MDSVTVEIKGLKEVNRALKVLPERVQKNILTAGVRAVASDFAKSAKRLAPVDSGDLKKSIKVKKRRSKNRSYVRFTVGVDKTKFHVFYGHMIEFGTANIPAQPFMRPAFEQNKHSAVQKITHKIRQRLDKEIEKARVR